MAHLKLKTLVVSSCATNCYICYNDETLEGFIVDPGASPERIQAEVVGLGVKPASIVLTHGHFDHIGAADALRKAYSIPIIAYEGEEALLADPDLNLSMAFEGTPMVLTADRLVKDGEELTLAGFTARVLHTPGHTAGSVCYYFPEEQLLLSGDTLFCGSLGRTDFPGGSTRDILFSIIRTLFALPEETKVYAGHNEPTNIGDEKLYNPVAPYISRVLGEQ
jgi:glyoxylase-like metal-dependent hydrolase (beta-lactamase superfamily II)